MIYFSLLFISPIVFLIFRKKENSEKLALLITCIAVFLLLALRSKNTGVDLLPYYNMYEAVKEFSFLDVLKGFSFIHKNSVLGSEWGYTLFTWIFAKIGLGYQAFLAIQSAFCVFSLYHFISVHSQKPSLSIVLVIAFGLIDYYYCIVRQALAFAILLYCVDFIEKKNYPVCVLLVLAATLFHRTSLVFIVTIPLCFLPITWWTSLVFIGLSAIILPLFPVLNNLVVKVMKGVYDSSSYLSTGFEFGELIFILLAIGLFMTFFYVKKKEVSLKDRFIYWAFMMTIPLQFLSMYMPIFGRLVTLTFLPFSCVGITNAFLDKEKEPGKLEKGLMLAIFVACVAYYGWCIFLDIRGLHLIPYRLFFME